jgi:uncharacterized protein (DUF2384 family)
MSMHDVEMAAVLSRAADIFGSIEAARTWVETPLGVFRGLSPRALIQSGRFGDLMGLLDTLESGFQG